MHRVKRYSTLIGVTLGVLLLVCACLKEDLSGCPSDDDVLLIGFDHVKPNYRYEVGRMDVYVFDADDVLYEVLSVNELQLTPDYRIPVRLPEGEYRVVSWSNLGRHYRTLPEPFLPGVTTLREATVALAVSVGATVEEELETLLFGGVRIAVGSAQLNANERLIRIPLRQNSYRINLTTEGLYADHDFIVSIADNNGCYTFDNTFAPSEVLQYTRGPVRAVNGEFAVSITTLRLERNRSTQLILTDQTTEEVLLDKDLISLILAMEEQSDVTVDFATQHEFDIHVIYNQATLSTTITVNGWEVSLGNQEELE